MALQVWLPLNGNLDNQGLSDVTITSSNITYQDGKIGQGATFNNGYIGITNSPISNTTTHFSFCFWMKNTSPSSTSCIYNGRTSTGGPVAIFILGQKFRVDDGVMHQSTVYFVPENEWHHYAITRDPSNIKIYVDGELKETMTSTAFTTGASTNATIGSSSNGTTTGSGNPLKGMLNDYRIYDHCLSPREVKEISKGLVLHYPLHDQYIESTTNISNQIDGYGGWNNSGSADRVWDDNTISKPTDGKTYSIKVTTAGNCALTFGRTTMNVPSKTLACSVYCYLSGPQENNVIYIRSTKTDGDIGHLTYKGNQYPAQWPINKWIRLEYILTTNSEATTVYFCTYANTKDRYIAFNGWQIEEKDYVTPYVNGTRNETTVYDCSGYGYNGTKVGNIAVSSDTARYSCSYNFPNKSYIEHPALPKMYHATYSFWVNAPSYTNYGMIYGQKDYPNGGNLLWIAANTESSTQWAYFGGNSPNYTKNPGVLSVNTWHHFCYVWNNGVAQWYLDGEMSGNATTYTSKTYIPNGQIGAIGNSYTGTNWSGTPFTGKISDFRIYATALSSEDVLELYNMGASIADNGTVFAYSIEEE